MMNRGREEGGGPRCLRTTRLISRMEGVEAKHEPKDISKLQHLMDVVNVKEIKDTREISGAINVWLRKVRKYWFANDSWDFAET